MKKFFYLGVLGLIFFEIANVYFIMPIPGSQEINSLQLAYLLHNQQWLFRAAFGFMILLGLNAAWKGSKFLVILSFILVAVVVYMTNYNMAADHMFYQTKNLQMLNVHDNKVDLDNLIIGVAFQNEAKAYPIQFIGYHHQVRDKIGTQPIMITYCTVCRSGRAFEPTVNGKVESFRLVGMDHYNAMFEDITTKSWWRQETGESVAGPLKGQTLKEIPSMQATLKEWLALYPQSLIMQPDSVFKSEYDSLTNFETGERKGRLTRRDTSSWHDKSWIAGIQVGQSSKAYDWNKLLKERIIYDSLSHQSFVIFIAFDDKSLFAYKIDSAEHPISIRNDTLIIGSNNYDLLGRSYQDSVKSLHPFQVYQEYWHSWKSFHPGTIRDQ